MVHAAICRYVRTEHRKPPVGRYVCSEKRQFETRTTHMENDVMSDIIGSNSVGNTGYEMAKPPGTTDSRKYAYFRC